MASKRTEKTNSASKPVVVSTEHRGVFFGYVPETLNLDTKTIRLEQARMAVYWCGSHGFTGLASAGPSAGSKIGPAAPAITLQGVVSIMEASPEAAAAWEKGMWS